MKRKVDNEEVDEEEDESEQQMWVECVVCSEWCKYDADSFKVTRSFICSNLPQGSPCSRARVRRNVALHLSRPMAREIATARALLAGIRNGGACALSQRLSDLLKDKVALDRIYDIINESLKE